ncbi:MAG TPA: helix-turn-helix domain-containing protein [Amycolatopsis sp.]|nr:helix-turn-helix domain-containing protein [Amycolatopsis sp.]
MTVRDAATWTNITRRSIYLWIKRYQLPTRLNDDGTLLVNLATIVHTEAATRPERHRKLASGERV